MDSPSIETVSMGTKNDGTTWYTFVRARIDEYPDSDSGEEYDIYFYLKYEGSAEYFVLTDMYFYSGVNVSKNIFGDIGALGNTLGLEHFAAWAENTNDFSEYISNAREFYSEYMEYLEAEAFAKDFMRDYISYVYEDGNPWEDKEGQIYTLLDYAKYVLNYINPSVGGFGVKDSVPMYTTEKLILKDGAWYYRGMIGGVLLSSENERINDFLGYMYLKLNRIEDTFEVEDFFLSDPVNFSHHFYEAEYEIKLMDMDEFIAWAELTNDYSRFIQNGKASLDSYIRKNVIDSAAMDFSDTFVNAAFLGGEKAWNVSAEGSLDKFISYFADYLLLSTNNGNVDRYTYEIKKSVGIGQDDGYYTSLLVNITEHRNDGTEVKYRTKIFLKLVLECKTAVVTDFYYNGDLPQCSEIFEKVGTNHFSLTDATFRAWAEETNDYSVYSQKALTAISELQ